MAFNELDLNTIYPIQIIPNFIPGWELFILLVTFVIILPALWPSIDERKLSFLYIIAFVVFILILIHSLVND